MHLRPVSFLFFCVCLLSAQDPFGRITGRVVDSSAAAVAGAGIRVTNNETGVTTSAVSDSAGIMKHAT